MNSAGTGDGGVGRGRPRTVGEPYDEARRRHRHPPHPAGDAVHVTERPEGHGPPGRRA